MAADETKLNEMIGKVITDIGATFHAPLVLIGEKLGLFKNLASGKMNGKELAAATDTAERYVQEWLPAMASGGYVSYDLKDKKYYLTEEKRWCWRMKRAPPICRVRFRRLLLRLNPNLRSPKHFVPGLA
jgi:hypothetical protein